MSQRELGNASHNLYPFILFRRSQIESGATNTTKAAQQSPTPSLDLAKSNDNTQDPVCTICSDSPVQTVFNPCGHAVCCEPCGSRVKKCLVCRATVTTRTKVCPRLSHDKACMEVMTLKPFFVTRLKNASYATIEQVPSYSIRADIFALVKAVQF